MCSNCGQSPLSLPAPTNHLVIYKKIFYKLQTHTQKKINPPNITLHTTQEFISLFIFLIFLEKPKTKTPKLTFLYTKICLIVKSPHINFIKISSKNTLAITVSTIEIFYCFSTQTKFTKIQ